MAASRPVVSQEAMLASPRADSVEPQRIVYRRVGADSLIARIEGDRAGRRQPVTFPYRKVSCAAVTEAPTAVAPEGWARPIGYAHGMTAAGRLRLLAAGALAASLLAGVALYIGGYLALAYGLDPPKDLPAARGNSLPAVKSQEDFNQIARTYHQNTPYALPHAMFVIDRRAKDNDGGRPAERARFNDDTAAPSKSGAASAELTWTSTTNQDSASLPRRVSAPTVPPGMTTPAKSANMISASGRRAGQCWHSASRTEARTGAMAASMRRWCARCPGCRWN